MINFSQGGEGDELGEEVSNTVERQGDADAAIAALTEHDES
jgi:hypothetical protein